MDLTDEDGKSPLFIASEVLLEHCKTPLYRSYGSFEAMKLLLDHGAQVDLVDKVEISPLQILHLASREGSLVAKELLEYGTQVERGAQMNEDVHFSSLRTNASFPGIFFLKGVKKATLTASEKINLENVGISMSIPENALPSTDPPLEVQIQPCFSGSWEVPENLELVSPAYIIKSSREVQFMNKVSVKIWHYANLETEEDCEDMVFLSASTTPQY